MIISTLTWEFLKRSEIIVTARANKKLKTIPFAASSVICLAFEKKWTKSTVRRVEKRAPIKRELSSSIGEIRSEMTIPRSIVWERALTIMVILFKESNVPKKLAVVPKIARTQNCTSSE